MGKTNRSLRREKEWALAIERILGQRGKEMEAVVRRRMRNIEDAGHDVRPCHIERFLGDRGEVVVGGEGQVDVKLIVHSHGLHSTKLEYQETGNRLTITNSTSSKHNGQSLHRA